MSDCENYKLPNEYGYVLIGVTSVCLTCIFIAFTIPYRIRAKVFNKIFMKQFQNVHDSEFSSNIEKSMGYPDMGDGYYSQKLPYKEWRQFSTAQRCHYNFLENLVPLVLFQLIGGLHYPIYSFVLSVCSILLRLMYCFYITDGGANNPVRLIGSIGTDLVQLNGVILAFMSGVKFIC